MITLEGMGACDVVEREDDMNVINGTWAFKCKRFPNGTVKKFKACFCARGDQQLEGIDFFETYAPVVQWTTVHLILILENLLSPLPSFFMQLLKKIRKSMLRCFLVSSSTV